MTTFLSKIKKPCFESNFGPFSQFLEIFWEIQPSCTTSHWFLAPCQNLEKTNDTIPRKHLVRWKDRRKDRPYFIGPFRLPPGVQKKNRNKMDQTEQILVVKGGLGESIITENL